MSTKNIDHFFIPNLKHKICHFAHLNIFDKYCNLAINMPRDCNVKKCVKLIHSLSESIQNSHQKRKQYKRYNIIITH